MLRPVAALIIRVAAGILALSAIDAMTAPARAQALWALLPALERLTSESARHHLLPGAGQPRGKVQFFNLASSGFDKWSIAPPPQAKAWMRAHYVRMLTYSSFFGPRLHWYPNAWVYHNATGILRDSSRVREHPQWILKDENGNRLYIPYACDGNACPRYAGDVGNPAFRADWINRARERLAPGYVGVWMDDINMTWRVGDASGKHVTPIDPRTGTKMTLEDWRRYLAEFVEDVRRAFADKEIAHNVVWYAASPVNDDEFIARQIRAADYTSLERGVNDNGLTGGAGRFSLSTFLSFIDYVHRLERSVVLLDFGRSIDERLYGLAGWLLVSDRNDMYSANSRAWTVPDSWWPGFSLNLGHAKGPRYAWREVSRRDFECGLVLLNEPDSPMKVLPLDAPLKTIDGRSVSSVSLAAKAATILLDDCACIEIGCAVATQGRSPSRKTASVHAPHVKHNSTTFTPRAPRN